MSPVEEEEEQQRSARRWRKRGVVKEKIDKPSRCRTAKASSRGEVGCGGESPLVKSQCRNIRALKDATGAYIVYWITGYRCTAANARR